MPARHKGRIRWSRIADGAQQVGLRAAGGGGRGPRRRLLGPPQPAHYFFEGCHLFQGDVFWVWWGEMEGLMLQAEEHNC